MVDDLHSGLLAVLLQNIFTCFGVNTWSLRIHNHLHLFQTHVYLVGESPDDLCPLLVRRQSMGREHREHKSAGPQTAKESIAFQKDNLCSGPRSADSCGHTGRATTKNYYIGFSHNRDFPCRLLEPTVGFKTKRSTPGCCHKLGSACHCGTDS